MRRPTLLVWVPVAVSLAVVAPGCSDGTPEFCGPLRANAELIGLGTALESADLEVAAAEARRLSDLAEEAPAEIRSDLAALGAAVEEIVQLLADEAAGTSEASEIERRREQLNDDLGELDLRSDRVSRWALSECGLDLG